MILCKAANPAAAAVVSLFPASPKAHRSSFHQAAQLGRSRSRVSAYLPVEHRVRESVWSCKCAGSRKEEEGKGEVGEEQQRVHCEVEVVSWRERRVRAWVLVDADADAVWSVLTDYERLADFIPNLVCSGRIPCPHPGRVWLEQRGLQRALYWHIEARVVLDLQEFPCSSNGHELHFSMVDGDFKKFEGKWSARAGLRSCTSVLYYEVNVIPRFNFPAIFLERIIRSDLPVNLLALAGRAERKSNQIIQKIVPRGPSATTSNALHINNISHLSDSLSEKEKLVSTELKEKTISSNIGINSNWGVFGKVCKLDKPCMVDEVHLRRYDGLLENGGVHRCVVASITVKSPVREVWNTLTAYDTLPEIVPNLAISKVLSRENNKVRILQEGCKGLLYMVLHARVVMDLWEHFEQEIRFEQVEGDFDSFQGKWLLEQLGNQHTLLKYTVESKMQKDSFLSEAIFEEVIYEDLPSNLCAIRDFVERREVLESNFCMKCPSEEAITTDGELHDRPSEPPAHFSQSDGLSAPKQRPRVPGLQRDIEVLKEELSKFISQYGQEGFMPMRKQLRMHGRVDIEKAINHMGGFRKIASLMNLSLAYKHRKPKGYWDDLDNLQEEICRFQRSWGMDPTYMPSRKTFEWAGRYDIARALEKWGGLHEVSRLLSLKVRYPSRQANFGGKEKRHDAITSSEEERTAKNGKSYSSHDTQKWLMELKHLDINWVD